MTSPDSYRNLLATKKDLLIVKQSATQCVQFLKLAFPPIISHPASRCDFSRCEEEATGYSKNSAGQGRGLSQQAPHGPRLVTSPLVSVPSNINLGVR